MNRPLKSRYALHVEKWKDGCGCELCPQADRKVFARGSIPCSVLFVGEAPGDSENLLGKPFCGPAGQLLDEMITTAWIKARRTHDKVTHAFYNLIGCLPREEDGTKSHGGLDHDWVMQCQPRLKEFLGITNPKLVVCLGKEPKQYLDPVYKHGVKLPQGVNKIEVIHPAAILRANVIQKGLLVQRAVIQIANAIEEL